MRRSSLVVLVGCLIASASLALGQQKPDRPPPPPPPAPPEINAPAFAQAYEAARRPTILTLVGFSTGEREAANVEDTLFRLDPNGFTFQLRASFNEFINPPEVDAELISATQIADASARIRGQLAGRGEAQAAQLLANETRAEIIVLIRLFGDKQAGRPDRAQLQVTNARGRELFSFPFQWVLGNDAADVRDVARLLAIEFTRDFTRRANAFNRWTLRLFDLNEPAVLQELRGRLEASGGIRTVRPRPSAAGTKDSYREFEVSGSLDSLDLESAVTAGLKDRGLRAETVSTEGGIVNIRVRALEVAAAAPGIAECVEVMTDRDSSQGKTQRSALENLYTRRQQPTFAVLVNRRPSTQREQQKAVAAGGGAVAAQTLIMVTGQGINAAGGAAAPAGGEPADKGNADDEFRAIGEINNINYSLETNVYNMLGTELLNFNRRVDGGVARAALAEKVQGQKTIFSDDELTNLLRQANIADFYITATGTILPNPEVTDVYDLRYSFRMLGRNGQLVASAPDVIGFAARSTARDANVRQAIKNVPKVAGLPALTVEEMAQKAVAKMACELLNEWQRNVQVNVTLKGVADNRDYLAIDDVFKKEAKGVALVGDATDLNIGGNQGTQRFTISYPSQLSFTDVQREIDRLNPMLPFDLVFEAGDANQGVTMSIKRR